MSRRSISSTLKPLRHSIPAGTSTAMEFLQPPRPSTRMTVLRGGIGRTGRDPPAGDFDAGVAAGELHRLVAGHEVRRDIEARRPLRVQREVVGPVGQVLVARAFDVAELVVDDVPHAEVRDDEQDDECDGDADQDFDPGFHVAPPNMMGNFRPTRSRIGAAWTKASGTDAGWAASRAVSRRLRRRANQVIGHELHDRSEVEVTVPAAHFDVLMLDPLVAEKPVETASQLDWYHLVTSAVKERDRTQSLRL